MTAPILRQAEPGDAPIISSHRYFRPVEDPADLTRYADWVAIQIQLDVYVGYLAISDGRPVAGAGAVILEWGPTRGNENPSRARIVNVFTDEEWRRQGIGASLVEAVLADCKKRGVGQFALGATTDSARIYERIGFSFSTTEMTYRA